MSSSSGIPELIPSKLFICSCCKHVFDLQPGDQSRGVPYLLDCVHRICLKCYGDKVFIHCSICFKGTVVEPGKRLPKDFFIIGMLSDNPSSGNSTCTKQTEVTKKAFARESCIKCGAFTLKACTKCEQGDRRFCSPCFEKSHNDEVWKDHHLEDSFAVSSFTKRFSNIDDSICSKHEDSQKVYCDTCQTDVCCGCTSKHSEHITKTYEDELSALKKSKQLISEQLEIDVQVSEDIQSMIQQNRKHASEAIETIDKCTIDLIAAIQVIQLKNKTKLQNAVRQYETEREEELKHLNEGTELLTLWLKKAEELIEKPPGFEFLRKVNIKFQRDLYNRKFFTSFSKPISPTNPYTFEFVDQQLPEQIQKFTKISFDKESMVKPVLSHKLGLGDKKSAEAKFTINTYESDFSSSGDEQKKSSYSAPSIASSSRTFNDIPVKEKMIVPKFGKFFCFEAAIGDFDSICSFFVRSVEECAHKAGENCYHKQVKKFMNSMQDFYNDEFNHKEILRPHEGFFGALLVGRTWQRVEIKSFDDSSSKVVLLDLGTSMIVKTEDIKTLHPRFYKLERQAIECCLAHIRPKDNNGFPDKADKKFKKLVIDSKFKIEIIKSSRDANTSPVAVVVSVFSSDDTKINVNAAMVQRFNCADSTGSDSRHMIEKIPLRPKGELTERNIRANERADQKQAEKRIEIEILNIIDPTEFYASLKSRSNAELDGLHSSIQLVAAKALLLKSFSVEPTTPLTLSPDDFCLVHCTIHKQSESNYYRGKVLSITESVYKVFLIDHGLTVQVQANDVQEVPDELMEAAPVAIRMHMPSVHPTGGSNKWTKSSIEKFEQTMARFHMQAVSVVGRRSELGSFPVIVWGITKGKKNMTIQKKFHNVHDLLIDEGYVHNTSKLSWVKLERFVSAEAFGWPSQQPVENVKESEMEKSVDEVESSEGSFSDFEPHAIKAWIENDEEVSKEFIGIVTNVNEDGVIFIRNKQQDADFKKLTHKLSKFYENHSSEHYSTILSLGQPVIAKNPFDAKYYRGRVAKLQLNGYGYKIELVDLGSSEFVLKENIFTKVFAADVPILAGKFRLSSVIPFDDGFGDEKDRNWDLKALNYIHGAIVDFKVKIQTNAKMADGTIKSSVYLKDEAGEFSIDLEKLLIDKKLVEQGDIEAAWGPKLKHRRFAYQIDIFDTDECKRLHDQAETSKIERFEKIMVLTDEIDVTSQETREYLKQLSDDSSLNHH